MHRLSKQIDGCVRTYFNFFAGYENKSLHLRKFGPVT
jgi:hypothetical protein